MAYSKIKNLLGLKFDKLLVEEFLGTRNHKSMWRCRCECGKETVVISSNLTSGQSRSCGCLKIELIKKNMTTHGHSRKNAHTRTYNIWEGLSKRCDNTKNHAYKYYGAKGIFVCEKWQDFVGFLDDMGECPPNMSLDRINGNDGYYKENCRWSDRNTQARNRSNVKKISAFGYEMTIPEWSEKTGLSYYTIYLRLRKGIAPEEALKK